MHRATRATYERWLWTAYEALNIAEDICAASGSEDRADAVLELRKGVQSLIHQSMEIRRPVAVRNQPQLPTT